MSQPAKRARKEEGMESKVEAACVNTIRALSADVVQKANSGHPGAPMGCAPMAFVLFSKIMKYNPANPKWHNRDRFVLSNGHASALLYTMLHLTGFKVSMDDLKAFRQLGSITPGHPEVHVTPGVEVTTGPLGQGISNAVGLALSRTHLAATYNRDGFSVLDNFTYVICGDGCLQEGVSSEAGSLAGHLGLGSLIVLYDDNAITIDGSTDVSFTEDVMKRYEAYGWQCLSVADGNSDLAGIEAAIREAQADTKRPTIIKVTTTIGFGSAKEGTGKVHGAPLGADDLAAVKAKYGLDPAKSFDVPEEVAAYFAAGAEAGAAAEAAWVAQMEAYEKAHPGPAAELKRRLQGDLPEGWEKALPVWGPGDKADATRNTSGKVLNALAAIMPELVGGSADLTGSNKTALACSGDFQAATPEGRYLRFGVREHGMAAVANGMDAYGGMIPFVATFLNFTGYALGAIRISALSDHRVLYIMTHDSIGLGEDGPTHQPVETLETMRAMPGMALWRPADGNETAAAYAAALRAKGPTTMCLSRQNVPQLAGSSVDAALKGGYTVWSSAGEAKEDAAPALVVVSTGTEVSIAIEGAEKLAAAGASVRVASMPCQELFEDQPAGYRDTVLPPGVPVLAVEAASARGWEKYAHACIGMTTFGGSAPYKALYEKFGITADNVAAKGDALIKRFPAGTAPPTRFVL